MSSPAAAVTATGAAELPRDPRLGRIDAARGLAIVQMIAYHFCYDLNHFGWIHVDMLGNPAWIAWRSAIVAQFVLLIGVSLALRAAAGECGLRPNWRRLAQVAACAALVSAASRWLFGARWIWFGVLHFAALAQLLAPPLARGGWGNLAAGLVLVAVGLTVHIPAFAPDAWSWIGFSPVKPQTEDFVPLLPWSGVVLAGIGAAVLWQSSGAAWARWLRRAPAAPWRPLAFLGRWPLTVYMAHQPVLFGLLALVGHA